jgi:hypothetical protein
LRNETRGSTSYARLAGWVRGRAALRAQGATIVDNTRIPIDTAYGPEFDALLCEFKTDIAGYLETYTKHRYPKTLQDLIDFNNAHPELVVWLARKDSNLRSSDPEDSRRIRRSSVRLERGADSDSVNPAGNQVEHTGRSQVNVIRSGDTGIDRIALDHSWEGGGFPLFPLLPSRTSANGPMAPVAVEATARAERTVPMMLGVPIGPVADRPSRSSCASGRQGTELP